MFIDRANWIVHGAFSQVNSSGTINWSRNNSILATDGNASVPSYSFGTSETLGFYKLSGTLIGTNMDASIALGDENPSNNPSLNFFSSNTGSYNTPSSRIQASSGSGSANSGAIQIDFATCNIATGVSGNKNTSTVGYSFSGTTGITSLVLQKALRIRRESYNEVHLVITGQMDSSADAQFSVSLPDRTTNWSDAFSMFGTGTCVNGAPTLEYSAVFVQSQSGSTNAQIAFGGFAGVNDAVVIQLFLVYERL